MTRLRSNLRICGKCIAVIQHSHPGNAVRAPIAEKTPAMIRVLFVGQDPKTVDFSDPAIPPGFDAAKIQAGIDLAANQFAARGWHGDLCMIAPDDTGIAVLEKQLASATYDCVVIGGGLRLPPKSLLLFERVVNAVHRGAPGAAIAFNTDPPDTADAAARWVATSG